MTNYLILKNTEVKLAEKIFYFFIPSEKPRSKQTNI